MSDLVNIGGRKVTIRKLRQPLLPDGKWQAFCGNIEATGSTRENAIYNFERELKKSSEANVSDTDHAQRALPDEEPVGKEAIRLLDLWTETAGAADQAPYSETMALLGKPNSAGWVWAREVKLERDFDAEQARQRDLAIQCVGHAEGRAERAEQELERLRAQVERMPGLVLEALELAEDVLSRSPFSTGIWPNGVHPQTGVTKLRDAIALIKGERAVPSRCDALTDEALAQIVMTTQQCGMGARDADGKFRKMFCDDESLTRYDGRRDECDCRATVKAIRAALALTSADRGTL